MPKNVEEAAATAMNQATQRPALTGGDLDIAKVDEATSVQRLDPMVTIGRWFIRGNTSAYERWVELAKAQSTDHAETPAQAIIAHKRIDGANFLLLRPCKNTETGLQVTYSKKANTFQISKLHLFLKRNKLVPTAATVFSGPCAPGTDSHLGDCLIMNVSEAKERPVEKKPKKQDAKPAQSQSTPAPGPAPVTNVT